MNRKRKGFSYYVNEEQIRDYMRLSVKDKFHWLEAINSFTYKVLSPQKRNIQERFRRGEI